ncbi:MAG: hypothetical protein EZS28_046169 [Streblomastix strix]|uniref:Uncharacterized protein n=1 Tax=Streblomastix strix TaxID=222440 RepID=A0A5J4TIT0_9EUKA|nr:MAG: hypothetical protein EZS28_046169 [Streblomastix strix]
MRRWIKTGTEITVKQTAKLIGKLNYLRLQFQEASLLLNTMDYQKAQAARMIGRDTTMIMNKIAIKDINWWIVKLRANIPAQLILTPPQMTMTTDAAPSGWGSMLEKELEMIAMAHGTWNKRQAKLTSNNREIKAITQGQRNFAKILKNSRVQSLAIRSDNSTAVRHQEMESINIINKGNQIGTQNNRKTWNLDPDYSSPRSYEQNGRRTKQTIMSRRLQAKEEVLSTDVSSDEHESNNRLIFNILQQPTAKFHVNKKRTRRNSNRRSQSNMEDGTSMDSSSYTSPSSSSEEDQRKADRGNDNSSTIARPDMVHRTGKRECSFLYAWLEQRNSGTRKFVNQKEFETPPGKDMLFHNGPKPRKCCVISFLINKLLCSD